MRISDWSSDVCSSDLRCFELVFGKHALAHGKQALLPILLNLVCINHVIESLVVLGEFILEMAGLIEPYPMSVIYSDVLRDHPDHRCDCGLSTPNKKSATKIGRAHV